MSSMACRATADWRNIRGVLYKESIIPIRNIPKEAKKCYLRCPTTPPHEYPQGGKQMRYDARGNGRFAPNNAAFAPPLVLRTRPPCSAQILGQKSDALGSLREHVPAQFELPYALP
jgi:hypothetical protein